MRGRGVDRRARKPTLQRRNAKHHPQSGAATSGGAHRPDERRPEQRQREDSPLSLLLSPPSNGLSQRGTGWCLGRPAPRVLPPVGACVAHNSHGGAPYRPAAPTQAPLLPAEESRRGPGLEGRQPHTARLKRPSAAHPDHRRSRAVRCRWRVGKIYPWERDRPELWQ